MEIAFLVSVGLSALVTLLLSVCLRRWHKAQVKYLKFLACPKVPPLRAFWFETVP